MNVSSLLEEAKVVFGKTTDFVDVQLMAFKPWEIVSITVVTLVLTHLVYNFVFDHEKSLSQRLKLGFFYYVKRFPIIRSIVEDKMKPVLHEVSATKLFPLKPGMTYKNVMPYVGKSHTSILREVDEYLSLDTVDWSKGNVSGTVYGGDPDLTLVASTMYHKFAWSNPLHPDVFPSLRKMEAEVVRMTCSLFNGDPNASCGFVTTGGTESILLACKTYRDWAYSKGIKKPEMVIPISAHAAFEKGAAYFKIKLKHVPVDPTTRKVDLHAMKQAINKNTCMLVGSTPQFPHGVLDPIADIAALGKRYGVPVHVDACLGGFLLPFMGEAGFPIQPCDFSVPGVTSISADTHKYGCAPKGSSVIMYKSTEFAHHQYFVSPDWQGGIYATPMFAGSRSGAIVAACWGTMVHIGREGYISNTRKIISTARTIENGLAQMNNLFVFGKPEMSVIAFGSMDFDIFRLSGELTNKGWNLNTLQFPPSIHLCCTMPHTKPGVADRFLSDVNDAVNTIMQSPKSKPAGAGAIYGMAQSIPDRTIVSSIAHGFLDALYDTTPFARGENGKA
uniref:sphinganine-1-phosphate aldolase n=1 Tax=Phallusia mammillata TaxID=59560 RepID=A0A6F9DSN7_9ASCI|nr:sphingosine-1-phosphate lyase 1-like [Phallusia mammillata]